MSTELDNNMYLISIPQRGIKIMPPLETEEKMRLARLGQKVGVWSDEEKTRLRLLIDCSILRNRYPTAEDGRIFMTEIDYKRKDELRGYAEELSGYIVEKWSGISDKDIAVVLYGSTTRGLVKCPEHPDPSNIDIFVTGNIEDNEKLKLLDEIRQKRYEIKERILRSCPCVDEQSVGGNAGVHVQDLSKLKNCNFSVALSYIAANATVLHDPSQIWACLEKEALDFYKSKLDKRRR